MSTNVSQGDGEVYEENWYDTMAGVMGNVLEVRFYQSMASSLEIEILTFAFQYCSWVTILVV